MTTRKEENLRALGRDTDYLDDYAPEVLETFENQHPDNDYWVQFNCPEFTSLCPITGQPDFAEIKIMYLPAERMVESKSLKLYLFSFRNHGDFHEDCVNIIMKDLVRLMDPKYIEVTGLFTPVAASASIPMPTTAVQVPSTRRWPSSDYSAIRFCNLQTASSLVISCFFRSLLLPLSVVASFAVGEA